MDQKIQPETEDNQIPGQAKTPTDIADKIEVQLSQISYSLSQFKEKQLVEVLNEDATQGRLYKLTEEGRKIKEELNSE